MLFRFLALLAIAGGALLWNVSPATADELRQLDRDLLISVKQAGLWAGPASRQAQEHGAGRRVRDVGALLADDHARLDVQVRALADRFGMTLPAVPTPEQQHWADQITAATGADLDRVYVNRVRAADGNLFGLASQVRAGTQNDDVRAFAQVAVDTVLRHLTLLESTGVAESTSLLVSPAADGTVGGGEVALGALLAGLATAATFGVVRLLGSPGKK
ncbi:DUF4142 domain-containing protein [Amycolatopsis sp. NPDC059021]|uniref:DUF4142 domain-containing protein n=1 Tax=Amycolatopsis sp. NPDC059021 TaxID=3346704 RepID=UPI003672FFD7